MLVPPTQMCVVFAGKTASSAESVAVVKLAPVARTTQPAPFAPNGNSMFGCTSPFTSVVSVTCGCPPMLQRPLTVTNTGLPTSGAPAPSFAWKIGLMDGVLVFTTSALSRVPAFVMSVFGPANVVDDESGV